MSLPTNLQAVAEADLLLRSEDSVEQALRPLFDQVWQAAGLLRSYNYDDQGNWAPQR